MKTIKIAIRGMQDLNDEEAVKEALYDVWGVNQVEVSWSESKARLRYDESAASEVDFEQAIIDQGFEVGEEG